MSYGLGLGMLLLQYANNISAESHGKETKYQHTSPDTLGIVDQKHGHNRNIPLGLDLVSGVEQEFQQTIVVQRQHWP